MTAFLLAISLLLNIVAFLAIILLFLRQNKLMEAEKNQEKVLVEMEDVISSYLIQMKEENDDFINKFSQINAKNQSSEKEKSIRLNTERKNAENTADSDEKSLRFARTSVYQASKAYKKNLRASEEEMNEPEGLVSLKETESLTQSDSSQSAKAENTLSIEDQVFMMKKQGLNVEDIAKKLGKGKTEIELMLKFRQNQQE
ncbi:hypothetical protein DFO70_103314 [Cytobacillus firmus]|uniref:Coupling factor for flagellin transcription and translation n=2 Tax=Cytobacillus TaxID=2675230 RepID=A0A366K0Q8_CYTFI|nr:MULTISPECIES: hypothetical protein [Cytobacillus]RBP95274.1 hypothetical protein DFO70_103314 [Cytobacillus firmus]TDX44115.1 hypothetical protein DFO72_104327 [Cytobacillus oceanisediminis]